MNVVVIPSLNPSNKLIGVVDELKKEGLKDILIIDDGSNDKKIFEMLEKENVIVIHHDKNYGKGYAIKTAVSECEKYFKNVSGYIFVDGDGQHDSSDALKLSKELSKTNKIILGIRNFDEKSVLPRSKFGNKFSSIFVKLITNKYLSDTQTGLRAIPIKYKKLLLNIEGNRYDYEMNFILYMLNNNLKYKTIEIKTIYEDNNSQSHFRPLKDSYLIYKQPIKFIISSITSFLIDILLFSIFKRVFSLIFLANILARLLSGIYNYNVNKYWCFKTFGKNQFVKYFMLFLIQMIISSSLVKLFSLFSSRLILIKIFIDITLFVISYVIQKKYVFRNEGDLYEKL